MVLNTTISPRGSRIWSWMRVTAIWPLERVIIAERKVLHILLFVESVKLVFLAKNRSTRVLAHMDGVKNTPQKATLDKAAVHARRILRLISTPNTLHLRLSWRKEEKVKIRMRNRKMMKEKMTMMTRNLHQVRDLGGGVSKDKEASTKKPCYLGESKQGSKYMCMAIIHDEDDIGIWSQYWYHLSR